MAFIQDKYDIDLIYYEKDGYQHRISNFEVDGFCKQTNTIYEFLGNPWHGYPPNHDKHTAKNLFPHKGNKTNKELYDITFNRFDQIRKMGPYIIKYIWEHETDLKNNVIQIHDY